MILTVLSSLSTPSHSSQYAEDIVKHLQALTSQSVHVRNLEQTPVTPITGAILQARGDAQHPVTREHDGLIEELRQASCVVFGVPMYNFGIPSKLKDYFDAITQAGKTFQYTSEGKPQGLLPSKPVIVVLSRGGMYRDHGMTFQEDYLRLQLQFIGFTDVHFVFMEGTALGQKPNWTSQLNVNTLAL